MEEAPQSKKVYQPMLATALGILFVSTASIFIRFAQAEASSIVIAAARLVIASMVLLPLAFFRYREELRRLTKTEYQKAILSGVFLALHFASWITSLQYTSVASSVVLVTTTPLWVALLSPVVLKEPIRRAVVIGLAVSMTGSVIVGLANACDLGNAGIVCQPGIFGSQTMLGNVLALFGAWMAAGYMLVGRQLRKSLSTIPYVALVYGMAALILLLAVVFRAEPVFSYSGETYLWLLLLGIFPQLLGHSLFNWALKYISAAYVSLTLLGEPIGTVILAIIFLKESPTLIEIVGAVLILIGIVIGSLHRSQPVNAA